MFNSKMGERNMKLKIIMIYIILFIMILVFCISIATKKIVVGTIHQNIILQVQSHQIRNMVADAFPELSKENLNKIEISLQESVMLEGITEKYIDSITVAIANGENVEFPDINDDLSALLDENMDVLGKEIGITITDSQKIALKKQFNQNSSQLEDTLQKASQFVIQSSIDPNIARIYQLLQAFWTRFIMMIIVLLFICLLLTTFDSVFKGLFHLSMITILAALVLYFLIPYSIQSTINSRLGFVLSNAIHIDFSILKQIGIITGLFGLISFCVSLFTHPYIKNA